MKSHGKNVQLPYIAYIDDDYDVPSIHKLHTSQITDTSSITKLEFAHKQTTSGNNSKLDPLTYTMYCEAH